MGKNTSSIFDAITEPGDDSEQNSGENSEPQQSIYDTIDDFNQQVKRSLSVILSGKLILFQGDYREKEISLSFSINPALDPL